MLYTLAATLTIVLVSWLLRGQRSLIRRHGKSLPSVIFSHNRGIQLRNPYRRPPGTLPFAGNGIWFLQARHKLLNWFSECERKTGFATYEISVPSLPPAIVINDPRNVEHVLKNSDMFIKGNFFRLRSWDLFGNGIINADGELWKVQRKAGLRFFSNPNLKTFINDVLPPLLNQTSADLDLAAQSEEVVDLQTCLLELTTRFMGNVAYDMDMPASLPFSKAFDFASGAVGDRFQNPFWKIKEFVWGAPLRRAVTEVKRFGDGIVSSAQSKRLNSNLDRQEKNGDGLVALNGNLIDSLLDHISDHRVVSDAAMNYLSAGRDTTAQSLTWTFYLLMRHPHVQQRVRGEIQTQVPMTRGKPSLGFDHLQQTPLPYTMAVFNETLRLFPPVPVELKECTASTTFPDGTWLPRGSVVLWVPWSMGRSKQIWGEDADDFRPERWLVEEGEGQKSLLAKSAYEFPVFNGGPRSCLGKRMAELLAVDVLATLVWGFDFSEVLVDGKSVERLSQNSLTLPMQDGLPCQIVRRSKRET